MLKLVYYFLKYPLLVTPVYRKWKKGEFKSTYIFSYYTIKGNLFRDSFYLFALEQLYKSTNEVRFGFDFQIMKMNPCPYLVRYFTLKYSP